jgi:hypothetical protein
MKTARRVTGSKIRSIEPRMSEEVLNEMYLIEILLPVRDNQGRPFAATTYQNLRDELTELYGGVTAFTRAPAQGETKAGGGKVHDDIIVFEVMTEEIDRQWWKQYRESLERTLEQDEIVVRATPIEKL